MLDKIQFLLSLQIIGFCIFGGATLLLRAGDNRAKRILGWGLFLWAFLAAIRLSVNLYLHKPKEAFHPDILIMDEPFGALDAQTRYQMEEELLHIWEKERKTIIFVTNNIEEAVYLADRIILLSACPAHVKEVFQIDLPKPRDLFDREFLRIRDQIEEQTDLSL